MLIAGEGSFIGTAVGKRLAEFPDGYSATAIDMRGDSWRAFDFAGFDSVVHVAGIAHVSPKPAMRALYERVNRDLAIEAAARAKEAGVRQFIFLSSSIVFGDAAPAGKDFEIAPDTPPAPSNAYGQSKLDAEIGIRALEGDSFRAAILRPMMVFGAGCRGNYTQLARFADRFPLFPDFPNRRGTVYIEHLAELIRLLIDRGCGGTFHAQDAVVSTSDFVRAIARARGLDPWALLVELLLHDDGLVKVDKQAREHYVRVDRAGRPEYVWVSRIAAQDSYSFWLHVAGPEGVAPLHWDVNLETMIGYLQSATDNSSAKLARRFSPIGDACTILDAAATNIHNEFAERGYEVEFEEVFDIIEDAFVQSAADYGVSKIEEVVARGLGQMVVLGLIPDCDLDQVRAVGNAAGDGAMMALLNRGHLRDGTACHRRNVQSLPIDTQYI